MISSRKTINNDFYRDPFIWGKVRDIDLKKVDLFDYIDL